MKATKITYWISTILTCALFTLSACLYLTHSPKVVDGFKALGYPEYLPTMLATAKILAVITLLVPKFPRLKEWAYAGLVFDVLGAFWSHTYMQGLAKGMGVLLPFILLLVSYITFRILQSKPETAIAK